jgi:hypothetical protein
VILQKVRRKNLMIHAPGRTWIFIDDGDVRAPSCDGLDRFGRFYVVELHNHIGVGYGQSPENIREIAKGERTERHQAHVALHTTPSTLDLGLGVFKDCNHFIPFAGKLLADAGEAHISANLLEQTHPDVGLELGQLL